MKKKNTFLITGAGTGFGRAIALALAKNDEQVIATTETVRQAKELEKEAKKKKLSLRIEKIDITNEADRKRAGTWDVDVLLNNAGISLGGSMADIPEHMLREQYEVNFFGTIFLTQEVVHQMIPKRSGKIVFVTSMHGLMADPISGPYCSSKFALEASAESLRAELQEYGIQVAVINPGPYLTGFNDREYESFARWHDDPSTHLYDYEAMAFPYEQIKSIDAVVKGTIDVMTGKSKAYRTVIPGPLGMVAKRRQQALWDAKSDEDLKKPHPLIKRAMDMKPATTVPKGIRRMLTKPFRKKPKTIQK